MEKILIAEDNAQIADILTQYSKEEGFDVQVVSDGVQAVEAFEESAFDVILLDVMMPKMDGFEVCRRIRRSSSVPIIMITARGEDFEKIMGLDIGADDYIVKPFSPSEVMARVRAILRRLGNNVNSIDYKDLHIDIDSYAVSIGKDKILLTKKEIEILWTLLETPGNVHTREGLLDAVWGYDYYGDTRTVDTHIKRLRSKLNECDHEAWDIKTVWGVGYKFEGVDE